MFRSPIITLAFVSLVLATTAEARGLKLKFESEFARVTYKANTCAGMGDFVYPASPIALGPLIDGWSNVQLSDPGISNCDAPYRVRDPMIIVTDEVLLGGYTNRLMASIAGEPCIPEPMIVLRGDLEGFYNDMQNYTSVMLVLVASAIEKHCQKWPLTLQVRIRSRTLELDPSKPATRKKPAGKMVVQKELYAGRYVMPPRGERYGIWQDADPAARERYMARVGMRPEARRERRRAELAVYAMENEEEIRKAMREFGAGLDEVMRMRYCGDILYRNNPNNVNYTYEDLESCRKFMSEPLGSSKSR